jgi:hypothetical protein
VSPLGLLLAVFGAAMISCAVWNPIRRAYRKWQIGRAIRKGRAEAAVPLEAFAVVALQAAAQEPAPRKATAPGRQKIAMPSDDHFGRPWHGPIPKHAHSARWEDCHRFPSGDKPTRDVFGLHGASPISFVCPTCELEQPPIQASERKCGYCGQVYRLVGSHLFWWRPETLEVSAWEPRR